MASKPIDAGHIVEFDRDDRVPDKRKAVWNVPLKCCCLSQETCANERLSRTTSGIDVCLGGYLSGAEGRTEMRRHPIDAPALKLVGHALAPLLGCAGYPLGLASAAFSPTRQIEGSITYKCRSERELQDALSM